MNVPKKSSFLDFVIEQDDAYDAGHRDEPMILEEEGKTVTDPRTGRRFPTTTVTELIAEFENQKPDDVGGGIRLYFVTLNGVDRVIRIRGKESQ